MRKRWMGADALYCPAQFLKLYVQTIALQQPYSDFDCAWAFSYSTICLLQLQCLLVCLALICNPGLDRNVLSAGVKSAWLWHLGSELALRAQLPH